MSLFDTMAAAGLDLVQRVFGETCAYTPVGGGQPITITVSMARTIPQIIAMDDHGQASDRIIALIVPMASVPTPSRGDSYQLYGASNAGIWFADKVERGDQAGWLVSIRYMSHDALAARSAIEVKP